MGAWAITFFLHVRHQRRSWSYRVLIVVGEGMSSTVWGTHWLQAPKLVPPQSGHASRVTWMNWSMRVGL